MLESSFLQEVYRDILLALSLNFCFFNPPSIWIPRPLEQEETWTRRRPPESLRSLLSFRISLDLLLPQPSASLPLSGLSFLLSSSSSCHATSTHLPPVKTLHNCSSASSSSSWPLPLLPSLSLSPSSSLSLHRTILFSDYLSSSSYLRSSKRYVGLPSLLPNAPYLSPAFNSSQHYQTFYLSFSLRNEIRPIHPKPPLQLSSCLCVSLYPALSFSLGTTSS